MQAQQGTAGEGYPPCTKTPSAQDETAARGAYSAGQVYFKEANYTQAITYWEDAYRRDCTAHKLLLNLATAYQLDAQPQNAVNALEAYLARVPNAADKAQVERRLEALQTKLDEQAAAAPPPPPPSPAAGTKNEPEPEPIEAEVAERSRTAPIVLAIVGGAVTVGGVIWVIVENGNVSHWEKICGPDHANCPPGTDVNSANAAQNRRTAAIVVASVGAGALATGLIWYFVSDPAPSDSSTALPAGSVATVDTVTPVVTDEFVGLGVFGRF